MDHAAPSPRASSDGALPRFPLGLCVGSVALTWLGVAAAALKIRWGADAGSQSGDALGLAWVYVNEAGVLVWLVLWPAARGGAARGTALAWEFVALAVGMMPAMGIAALVAEVARVPAAWSLGAQGALALLAAGILALGSRFRTRTFAAVLLVAWGTLGPVLAYLCMEFLPQTGHAWRMAVPALLIAHATGGGHPAAWIAGYGVAGGIMLAAGILPRR